ncbi:MAG: hypothetical protein U1C49_03070 [Candidatus Andersenbacteria bacterium]|nr:hypothetical protein [bacterium]MDZ4225809.1 hypothetical protein [Candidatus Andersenbacteria bacterium]
MAGFLVAALIGLEAAVLIFFVITVIVLAIKRIATYKKDKYKDIKY